MVELELEYFAGLLMETLLLIKLFVQTIALYLYIYYLLRSAYIDLPISLGLLLYIDLPIGCIGLPISL